MVRPNRSELARLRGKETPEAFSEWVTAFGEGDEALAARYALALETFLGPPTEGSAYGSLSPRTRQAYRYAVTEFFEWLARERGQIVPPHRVTSRDAEAYVEWLSNRTYSLEAERLRDGDQEERLALYRTIAELGSTDLIVLARSAPAWLREKHPHHIVRDDGKTSEDPRSLNLAWLHHELGRMVLHDLLVRTPTMTELRRENPQLGISVFTVVMPDPETGRSESISIESLFSYSVPKPRPVGRATIALRLAALSAFWEVLARGENVPGGEAVLKYNIFGAVQERVNRGLGAERREASAKAQRLTPELVERLLRAADGPTLVDKRNAALLWFLVLTGARVSEAVAIRRGQPRGAGDEHRWRGWLDVTSEPPGVWLRRKGDKRQWLPFPPYALKALYAFQAELWRRRPKPETQSTEPGAPHYLHPDSPAWRYKLLAEMDDAPLFPPVGFWGANSTFQYEELRPNISASFGGTHYTRPMTRHGVEQLLRRVALRADLSPEDTQKVHAHALRHFAATAMVSMGKPLREVQAILGHQSITTTELYVEKERRSVALSGQNEILDYLAAGRPKEHVAPPEPYKPPEQRTIETYGVARPEKAPGAGRVRREARAAEPAGSSPAEAAVETMVTELRITPPDPLPVESPRLPEPVEVLHQTAEGTVEALAGEEVPAAATEVRDGVSPGSPFDVYGAMEPGAEGKPEVIEFTRSRTRGRGDQGATLYRSREKDFVQKNPFLMENYDPWPLHYGLGQGSLLPWFSKSQAESGEVEVDIVDPASGKRNRVRVPPLPVLAPDQVYPEAVTPRQLFTELERLTSEWMATEPTKVYGLRRWYATFAYMTAALERDTERKYQWVPFESLAKIGENIRAHDDGYLVRWFEHNSGRYTATVRAFRRLVARGDSLEDERFRWVFDMAAMESASLESIPEWFAAEDPVRQIYDETPDEWPWFLTWLRSVTGAKMSPERKSERRAAEAFAKDEREALIETARHKLELYYDSVTLLDEAKREGDTEAVTSATLMLKGGTVLGKRYDGLEAELSDLGITVDFKEYAARYPRVRPRIEAILAAAFPEAEIELVDPNVLRSELFDPEAFRIDEKEKTLRHTAAFRKIFRARYDGRDSECVMRRATRAMWEYVRRAGIVVERGAERRSQYSMLYATMLTTIAWIFPCPEDMERAMATALSEEGKGQARAAYLIALNKELKSRLLGSEEPEQELPEGIDTTAMEIAIMFAAAGAEHGIPADAALKEAVRAEALSVRRAGGEKERPAAEPTQERPTVIRRVGRRVVISTPKEEISHVFAPVDELAENPVYLTPNAYRRAMATTTSMERALPSQLAMIAAMTLRT
jgi:site-specific recombinase XerD